MNEPVMRVEQLRKSFGAKDVLRGIDLVIEPGTVLGVLTVGILKNGLNVMAVPSSLQIASIGMLAIVALLIDSIRGRS